MKKIYALLSHFIAFSFSSCSLQDHILQPTSPDIYVAGYEQSDTLQTALYWKNGQPTNLGFARRSMQTSGIAVGNGVVHVIGYDNDTGFVAKPVYWKNGVATQLEDTVGFVPSVFNDVEIFDGDVYIAGSIGDFRYVYATYWKNGKPIVLKNDVGGWATGITVSGKDVYVSGWSSYNSPNRVARYWKNGYPVALSDGKNESLAHAIAVSGNDVYVVGEESDGMNARAKYWKNGVAHLLSDDAGGYSRALDVFISGDDVYIAGYEIDSFNYGKAKYWKNGVEVFLPDGYEASSIWVMNNDVYVVGNRYNGTKYVAVYWKNGLMIPLSDGKSNRRASTIKVVNP